MIKKAIMRGKINIKLKLFYVFEGKVFRAILGELGGNGHRKALKNLTSISEEKTLIHINFHYLLTRTRNFSHLFANFH